MINNKVMTSKAVEHIEINKTDEYVQISNLIVELLDEAYIPYSKVPKRIKPSYLKESRTINFGIGYKNFRPYGPYKANYTQPIIYELLKQLINLIRPDFIYKVITVNKNVMMNRHKDKHNESSSLFFCLGDFKNGGLILYDENNKPTIYDCRDKYLNFNGSLVEHETEPFTGTRYSIIVYNSTIY